VDVVAEVEYVAVAAAESLRGLRADDAALVRIMVTCEVGSASNCRSSMRGSSVMFRYKLSFT